MKVKLSQKVTVKNSLGLHARPATVIAKILQKSQSKVYFSHKNDTINAHSIMSILMLAANQDSQIVIDIEGEDAEVTLKTLVNAFESEFGESESEL